MSAQAYLTAATEALQQLTETGLQEIEAAADMLVHAITADRQVFAFGASHSFMAVEEMVYRTGGLMLINPIYPHAMNLFVRPVDKTSQFERVEGLGQTLLQTAPVQADDVVIIVSTSGRNPVVVDLALDARERGLRTIGITSRAYTNAVASRHSSGKKLIDVCDLVIDNAAPHGDAAVAIAGFPDRVGPLSSVTACAIVNAMVAETVRRLVDAGETPPVYMSANVDGGDEHNARLLQENAHRIHYL